MLGVVLAGGKGTRLKPFTNLYNKHFILLRNKPIIFYSLLQFKLSKIKNVCIVCNKKDEKYFRIIIKFYFNFEKIFFVYQNNPMGILHGIYLVSKKFKKNDLVVNLGDHFLFNFNGNKEIHKAIQINKNILFSIKSNSVKEYGNLKFSKKNNQLVKIIEKPIKKYSNYILCGMIKINSQLTSKINLNKKSIRGEYEWVEFINENIDNFTNIKLNRKYHWIDLGTFERLSFANDLLTKYENF
tara:strand:+ start:258 stop:980 length:723 start_codon:yes stop_codon:yes gene_type:complete